MYALTALRTGLAGLFLIILPLTGCEQGQPPPAVSQASPDAAVAPAVEEPAGPERPPAAAGVVDLEWDALVPADYQPDKLLADYDLEDLSDDDPRARELMGRLQELWDQAPVKPELDGEAVRLPGFVVPLEDDTEDTSSFLLVPYYGACVHVPPPPANQTVYVLTQADGKERPGLFDVVWVTGTMSVKRIANDIAEAGYTLYATDVEPYE